MTNNNNNKVKRMKQIRWKNEHSPYSRQGGYEIKDDQGNWIAISNKEVEELFRTTIVVTNPTY